MLRMLRQSLTLLSLAAVPLGSCILFVLIVCNGWSSGGNNVELLVRWGALSHDLVADKGEWWRLITYNFLHADVVHLLNNLYFLVYCLVILYPQNGPVRLSAVVWVSGIVSGLFVMFFGSKAVTVGASGVVFGLLGYLLVWLYHNKVFDKGDSYGWFKIAGIIGINILFSLNSSISMSGHLGGLFAGLVLGFVLVPSIIAAEVEAEYSEEIEEPDEATSMEYDKRLAKVTRLRGSAYLMAVVITCLVLTAFVMFSGISNTIGYDYYLDAYNVSLPPINQLAHIFGAVHAWQFVVAILLGVWLGHCLWKRREKAFPGLFADPDGSIPIGMCCVGVSILSIVVMLRIGNAMAFGLNYLTAKPADTTMAFVEKGHVTLWNTWLQLQVDPDKPFSRYDLNVSADTYKRLSKHNRAEITAEWKKGCLGYWFISGVDVYGEPRRQEKKEHDDKLTYDRNIMCMKGDTVFKVCVRIKLPDKNPEVIGEVTKTLFRLKSHDVEPALWRYLHDNDFKEDDSLDPTSANHYQFLYAKRELLVNDMEIFRIEAYQQDGDSVTTLCDKRFKHHVKTDEIEYSQP